MPIFGDTDNPLSEDAQSLAPISRERLEATLTDLEITYGEDEDGDLIAGFEGHPCWFRITGPDDLEIAFSFNGRWRGAVPVQELPEAVMSVNEWNATQMFPRALCVEDGEGQVIFGADYLHDYEFGVTDQQLRNDVQIAVTTALNYFAFLDESFPHGLPAEEDLPADHDDAEETTRIQRQDEPEAQQQ